IGWIDRNDPEPSFCCGFRLSTGAEPSTWALLDPIENEFYFCSRVAAAHFVSRSTKRQRRPYRSPPADGAITSPLLPSHAWNDKNPISQSIFPGHERPHARARQLTA